MHQSVAKQSTTALMEEAEQRAKDIAVAQGRLMVIFGELSKREGFRTEGATSLSAWAVQRCGVSEATGRAWSHVAERLDDLPHLAQGLLDGAVSFDKIRAVVDLAEPETDAELLGQATEYPVRHLADLARHARGASEASSAANYDSRYLRFNDSGRTITARLPEEHYASVRATITQRARAFTSDGETPYDQRLCDAFIDICLDGARPRSASGSGAGSGFLVVAHTDLSFLRRDEGSAEIQRVGLLSAETIRRLTCDASVTLALDDDLGHTMYEGRSKRFPTDAQRREVIRRDRWCRFPDCSNALFTNVHHITHWINGGLTDLDNLVLLCDHHHHRIHEDAWKLWGNANENLVFVGPSGREMTTRPSPLWTKRVSSRLPP
ncbi:MAG TPA: DUF222 domain-containing protein [Acidimicrobiales bacterium]